MILISFVLLSIVRSFESQNQLVDHLKERGIIKSPEVEEVMRLVDRAHFIQDPSKAYIDEPQPIEYGAFIEAPSNHAVALEHLAPILKSSGKCLDIGFGSGYMTVAMRLLMKRYPNAVAMGLDHVRNLTEVAHNNLEKAGFWDLLDDYKIVFTTADGREGLKRQKRFDCIYAGFAFPSYPKVLETQLNSRGRMVVAVGSPGEQKLFIVDKDMNGKITKKEEATQYGMITELKNQCEECFVQEEAHQLKMRTPQVESDFDFDFSDEDL